MSRIARNCYNTSFFHVIVQGIKKEYIFKNETYIKQYMKMINKYKKDVNVEILAYCIMNNHAHMLLYTEKIEDMSKFMLKVNTGYAKYYNCMENGRVGYVFRDRYFSEPIFNDKQLVNCINYIHLNPLKANIVKCCEDYKYSSYMEYISGDKEELISNLTNIKFDIELFKNTNLECTFKDIDMNIEESIEGRIEDFLKVSNIKKAQIFDDRILLKMLINYLKKVCKIKYTDMMKVLNISKGRMEKLKGR